MKTIITKKHEYLSGWTAYDMTWKTDFPGVRNKTIQSAVVVTKEPFSTKTLKAWAAGKGVEIDALFTEMKNCKDDCEKMNLLCDAFNEEILEKNLNELNSDDKCHVHYTATLEPSFKPLKTAFETFEVYTVVVRIEYKSGAFQIAFPSLGRKKNTACTRIVLSGNRLKAVYEGDEAIEDVKGRIERYIKDCDSDEKFAALPKKLKEIQKEVMKYFQK